jgi:hypothetical protein
MLTDDKIITVIKEYEREYAILRKDSDAFYKIVATHLRNTIDNEKKQVMDFFLREIKSNMYEMRYTVLAIIQEMKAVELCPYIVDIYNEQKINMDNECKRAIISLLMRFRYLPPQNLYKQYIVDYMKNNKNSFYLLVQYCNVSPKEALPLLAKEFVENILSKEDILNNLIPINNSLHGIYILISFLVYHFKKNPVDYLPELLELIYAKNPKSAIYLKDIIIDYLNSEFAKHNYPKPWLDNEINKLCKII